MTRLPERLRLLLEHAAEESGRSMNSEIIYRLDRSFDREEVVTIVREEAARNVAAVREKVDLSPEHAATLESLIRRILFGGLLPENTPKPKKPRRAK
jgi:hypothetical protein